MDFLEKAPMLWHGFKKEKAGMRILFRTHIPEGLVAIAFCGSPNEAFVSQKIFGNEGHVDGQELFQKEALKNTKRPFPMNGQVIKDGDLSLIPDGEGVGRAGREVRRAKGSAGKGVFNAVN